MSKFCENCGKELSDGAKFCNGCGAKLMENKPAQTLNGNLNNIRPQNISGGLPRLEPIPKQNNSNKYIAIGVAAAVILVGGTWLYKDMKENIGKDTATITNTQQKNEIGTGEKKEFGKSIEGETPKYNAQKYVPIMKNFEKRLADLAGRINGGKESKDSLISAGNVLTDDIQKERNLLEQDRGSSGDVLQDVNYLMGLQKSRAMCMVAGVKGNTEAFAEGGGYYDEFQSAFAGFKKERNYKE